MQYPAPPGPPLLAFLSHTSPAFMHTISAFQIPRIFLKVSIGRQLFASHPGLQSLPVVEGCTSRASVGQDTL
jgi:hypothetical protein